MLIIKLVAVKVNVVPFKLTNINIYWNTIE